MSGGERRVHGLWKLGWRIPVRSAFITADNESRSLYRSCGFASRLRGLAEYTGTETALPSLCAHNSRSLRSPLAHTHLDHRVDDKDQRGADTTPQALDAVLLQDGREGARRRRLLLLARLVGHASCGLVRLYRPDGVGDERGDGSFCVSATCSNPVLSGKVAQNPLA